METNRNNIFHLLPASLQDGGTALTVASQYGHAKTVDTLLRNGANVHDQLNVRSPVVPHQHPHLFIRLLFGLFQLPVWLSISSTLCPS